MLKSMKRFDTWLNEYRLETDKRTDSECRNGRLGPLTVAATLTRPFLRTKGATFGSTITNMKTKEMIEVGQIYTTSPDMSKQDCSRLPVGGGSFQEYYDGGNL